LLSMLQSWCLHAQQRHKRVLSVLLAPWAGICASSGRGCHGHIRALLVTSKLCER